MTIEELENYRYIEPNIKDLEKQIDSLSQPYRSPAFDKVGSFSGNVSNPTEEAANKIIELTDKKEALKSEKEKVEYWTEHLVPLEICTIVKHRYYWNQPWNQVSCEVYGHAANGRQAYRVFHRYMDSYEN